MCTPSPKPTKHTEFPWKWFIGALYITLVVIAGFYYLPGRCCSSESSIARDSEIQLLRNQIESLEIEIENKNRIIESQKELINWKNELVEVYERDGK